MKGLKWNPLQPKPSRNLIRSPAVSADSAVHAGRVVGEGHALVAVLLLAGLAVAAVAAGVDEAAHAHLVADLDLRHVLADL